VRESETEGALADSLSKESYALSKDTYTLSQEPHGLSKLTYGTAIRVALDVGVLSGMLLLFPRFLGCLECSQELKICTIVCNATNLSHPYRFYGCTHKNQTS